MCQLKLEAPLGASEESIVGSAVACADGLTTAPNSQAAVDSVEHTAGANFEGEVDRGARALASKSEGGAAVTSPGELNVVERNEAPVVEAAGAHVRRSIPRRQRPWATLT